MRGGGGTGQGNPRTPVWNATSVRRQRQARDAPWSCGNQSAYHSMINRRSVPALHRACLHQRNQPEVKAPNVDLRPSLLKKDMTTGVAGQAGDGVAGRGDGGGRDCTPRARSTGWRGGARAPARGGEAADRRDSGYEGPGAGDHRRRVSPLMRDLWTRAGQQGSLHREVPLLVR
jgi:hypothetical protein